MPHILFFSRNRSTSVEHIDESLVRACCRLQDTLMDAVVEILVRLPDLELAEVRAGVFRSERVIPPDAMEDLRKAIGTRIGPGLLKIMKGLVGNREDSRELVNMLEECCQGVILSFTKDALAKAPEDGEKAKAYYTGLVKENVRLYDSCIAFAPDSPLVQGIEPPKRSREG
jgi:hypothetical protein